MSIRRMLYGVIFVAVSASAVLGMDLYVTYRSLSRPPVFKSAQTQKFEIIKPRKVEKIDYSKILKRDLFSSRPIGYLKKKKKLNVQRPLPKIRARKQLMPKRKPVPALRLQLVGTTVRGEGLRYAIFKDKGGGTQKIHRVGERINGAYIKDVRRNEVTLIYDGKTQIFRAFEERKKNIPRMSRNVPGRPPRMMGPRGPVRSSLGRPVPPPRKQTRILSRPRLKRIINRPPGLKSQFRVVPFRSKDGDTGLRVFPAGRGRFLRYLGIRGGDVIFEVNNDPVRNKLEMVSALSRMIEGESGTIGLLRQGKKEKKIFRIR